MIQRAFYFACGLIWFSFAVQAAATFWPVDWSLAVPAVFACGLVGFWLIGYALSGGDHG